MEHKVAGISYQEENVKEILPNNFDWELTNRELKDYHAGERVWQYDMYEGTAEIVPEPDNQYDPNALAVYVEGLRIGYVKKGSQAYFRNVRTVDITIGGGPYKDVTEDEVEYGGIEFYGRMTIPSEDPAPVATQRPTPAAAPVSHPKTRSKTVCLLLWFFLGIFGGHKFYDGKIGMGVLYIFTAGLFLIGWIVDLFQILKRPATYTI